MSHHSAFKTFEGEAAFRAAYDAALKRWPVPYEERDLPGRFGTTHVVVCGRKDAPPVVLLHGYTATATMWSPNILEWSRDHRVYAIDVMGQPGKSLPGEPIRDGSDYVAWLTATLDALGIDRTALVGMSYGGWLALAYAVAAPARVRALVLLSPGGFLPITWQFRVRGMLMMLLPTRLTVRWFMHWAGFGEVPGEPDAGLVLDLMYLGMKHFRMPPATLRVAADPLPDESLRRLCAPVLLLIGENEVLYDPSAAVDRARRCIPDVDAELVANCSHDMCASQSRIVNARVHEFLWKHAAGKDAEPVARSVA